MAGQEVMRIGQADSHAEEQLKAISSPNESQFESNTCEFSTRGIAKCPAKQEVYDINPPLTPAKKPSTRNIRAQHSAAADSAVLAYANRSRAPHRRR